MRGNPASPRYGVEEEGLQPPEIAAARRLRAAASPEARVPIPFPRREADYDTTACRSSDYRDCLNPRFATPPSARPIKLTGVIFGGLKPLAVDPVRDPPGGHCFNCWQHGHSRRACPRPPRRGYCINCGRRGEEVANCPRCGERHRARQLEWETRGRPNQGASDGQACARSRTPEAGPREPHPSPSSVRRNRRRVEEEGEAQRMPPPPAAPATNPSTTAYLAQILRDTRDVDPEVRHQILRVVLGEGTASRSPERPGSARPP